MAAFPMRLWAVALAAAAVACANPRKSGPARAAASASAPASAAADAADAKLLAGCAAAPVEAVGWRYHCGSAVALRADYLNEAPDKVMAAGLAALRSAAPVEPVGQPLELLLDGEWRPALRAVVSRTAAGRAARVLAQGGMAVLDYGDGRARLLSCMARADAGGARCDALLEMLAGRPWRDGPIVAPGRWPPSMAGREVLRPKGCEASAESAGGIVRCPGGVSFAWTGATTPAALEPVAKERLASASAWAGPAAQIKDESCLVDDAKAICHCALARRPEGAVRACLATAPLRGQVVLVECRGQGEALPPACDAVDLGAP